jgi:Lysyl oxidase
VKRRPLLALLPLLAAALVAPSPTTASAFSGPTSGTTAGGVPGATGSSSPIRLWMPSKAAVALSRGDRVHAALGLQLIAQNAPFELWSHREDYDSPIVTAWRSGAAGGQLPAGTMKDFSGLRRFVTITITDRDGDRVESRTRKACLASWGPQRLTPTAVATSPYPRYCPYHPYTLGSVQGIPQDYAIPLEAHRALRLEPGRYGVEARLKPALAAALGVSSEDARATSTLVVPRREEHDHAGHGHPGETMAPRPGSDALRPAARPTADRAGAPAGPLPDLRSLPAFEISLNAKQTQLRFAATVWNGGTSPLVIDGFRDTQDESKMDSYQYFYDAEGEQTGYQRVGSMKYHGANHNHWHYEDVAEYSLVDADGQPVATSRKVSFCLVNTDAVDLTRPGADWLQDIDDLGSMCGDVGALAVRQQLSAGHGDTYFQFRAGQAISLEGVPNGTYYLKISANPYQRLVESDTANNDSYRRIRLVGKPGQRRVVVPSLGRIVEPSMMGGGGR